MISIAIGVLRNLDLLSHHHAVLLTYKYYLTEQTLFTTSTGQLNPYPDKPRVTFRQDGSFKLTIFSDVHFGENPWDSWGPVQDIDTNALMQSLLDIEEPDYVVINGDLITGENTFRENSTSLIDEIVRPLNAVKVPFSSTSGNHDTHINITRAEEIAREISISPLSYTRFSPPGVGGVGGPANYWVPVYEKTTDSAPALVLWFFDSRGTREGGVYADGSQMPDWVDSTVAEWIASETEMMNDIWGPPELRSALAFVHIPPHAIQAVQENLDSSVNPGLNADQLGQGSTQATDDPASLGKDNAFWQSLNSHIINLRAVISGHDHGNEWCAREPTYNVIFCFNKHSGYGGYSSPGWGRGIRSLVFRSAIPGDGIESYIMFENGTTQASVVLDADY
ncbi:Metallo-dependent phosphatase [Paxillus ammoniavirescens]|nr:Metallo-dependent phosphatase [Paxillus ammoniavirescens]